VDYSVDVSVPTHGLPEAPVGFGAGEVGGRATRMADRWAFERRRNAGLQTQSYAGGVAVVVLVVGLALALFREADSDATLRGDELALSSLAQARFESAALTPASGHAPNAKVLYAKDGTWLYLIVEDGDAGRLHVVLTEKGVARDLGSPLQRGGIATLFVKQAGKPQRVALRDRSGLLAAADLKY
jgi:hypothetical protein